MRKRELVHLHALATTLRREVKPSPGAIAEYDELEIAPTGIHRSKATHRRAVLALFDAVGRACQRQLDASNSVTGADRRT